MNLRRESSGRGRIALAAHWEGARDLGGYCHMHISHPGYTGISPVGSNRANVVLTVDRKYLAGDNMEQFFRKTVLGNRLRRRILGVGGPVEKVKGVDSLAYSVKKPKCGGLLLVGDATGFLDPFFPPIISIALLAITSLTFILV